ncbi:resolvase [Clostridia bacterium]|nr:resolvase [Clostridia bacterium]
MIAAYMRISTNKESQKHDRQEKVINDYAKTNGFTIREWFKDTISGRVEADNRPNYQHMKKKLQTGDTIIVSDLDRLGRDASNTIVEIKELQAKGVKLIALDIPYMNEYKRMNDDSMSRMIIDIVVTLKAHIAQQEREKTVTRINQGLAVVKEKGVKLGRPQNETPPVEFIRQYERFLSGEYGNIKSAGFAKMIGISRTTLYKYKKLYAKTT